MLPHLISNLILQPKVKPLARLHSLARGFRIDVLSVLVGFCWFSYSSALLATTVESESFWQQRSLSNLLFHLNQQGWQLIYSDKLVTPEMMLEGKAPEGDTLTRLHMVLTRHGLAFIPSNGHDRAGFIVKAAPSRTLSPVVIDAKTGAPLIFSATVDGVPVTNNAAIAIFEPWMQSITFAIAGYHSQTIKLADWPANNTVALAPILLTENVENVWVTASYRRWQAPPASAPVTRDSSQINQKPARAGDPLVAMADTPGFVTNSVSVRPYVRGGDKDELQVLIDGVEIYSPYHLKDYQSLVSGFNGPVVGSIENYTGGYPARYGSTMSGVMAISSALPESGHAHTLEVNPIFSALTFSRGTAQEEGYLLSLRRGNLETVVSAFNENDFAPRFFDVFAKKQWRSAGDGLWRLGALALHDDINLHRHDDYREEDAWSTAKTQYAWLQYETNNSANWQHQWQAVASHISNLRFGNAAELNSYQGELKDQRRQNALELNWHFNYDAAAASVSGGISLGYFDVQMATLLATQREGIADVLGLPASVAIDQQRDIYQHRGGSYLSLAWEANPWQATLGGRVDWQYGDNQLHQQLSPRLAIVWDADSDWAFDLSAGRFYQVPHLLDLPLADGAIAYSSPQKSDHYVLGAIYRPSRAWQTRFAFYQKKIFSPKIRYENMFNPYRLLPELASDRIAIAAQNSLAKGIEMSASWQTAGALQYSASFAFGEVEDNTSEGVRNRSWSQTRTLHVGVVYDARPWQLSAHGYWGSGRPYTRLPTAIDDAQLPFSSNRNEASLPDSYRLDIKASYFWQLPASSLEAYADITNVLGFEPVDYHEARAINDENNWEMTQQPESATPRIPVVGVKWVF